MKQIRKPKVLLCSIILLSILLSILFSTISVTAVQNKPAMNDSALQGENKEVLYRDFLLSQLSPYISKEINKYYGKPKSFDLFDSKVLGIKRLVNGSYYFEITVQVISYEGAHNPPYGIETITITKDYKGMRAMGFKHEEYEKAK